MGSWASTCPLKTRDSRVLEMVPRRLLGATWSLSLLFLLSGYGSTFFASPSLQIHLSVAFCTWLGSSTISVYHSTALVIHLACVWAGFCRIWGVLGVWDGFSAVFFVFLDPCIFFAGWVDMGFFFRGREEVPTRGRERALHGYCDYAKEKGVFNALEFIGFLFQVLCSTSKRSGGVGAGLS